MKTNIKAMLAALALACAQTAALAQMPLDLAQTLTKKSGTWEQLKGTNEKIVAGMMQVPQVSALGADQIKRITRVADEAFAVAALRDGVVQSLAAGLSVAQGKEALRWYDSVPGKKMTALEEAASADMLEFNTVLEGGNALLATASDKRRAQLTRLVKLTRTAEGMAGMQINMLIAISEGVAKARAEQGGPEQDVDGLRDALQGQRHQMVAAMSGIGLSMFAWIYREASDKELESYLKFLQTPSGQALSMAMLTAMDATFTQAAKNFGKGMVTPRPAI